MRAARPGRPRRTLPWPARCRARRRPAPERRSTFPHARGAPPLAVWTSPLRRCSELAAQLALRTRAALRIDDRLAEIDFGDWEGCSWDQIERQHPHAWRAWLAGWREVAPPRGETLEAFEARVRSWLEERTRAGEIGSSILVGHAGVIRALQVLDAGATWDHALAKPVPYLEWLTLPLAGARR
jgi:broad specificity phosphatase PhoE